MGAAADSSALSPRTGLAVAASSFVDCCVSGFDLLLAAATGFFDGAGLAGCISTLPLK